MKKRLLSIVLTAVLCLGLLPTAVFAENEGATEIWLGGGGVISKPATYPVQAEENKDSDGSVSLSKSDAAKGDIVTITVKPDRYYKVGNVIVRDSKGKELPVKDNGNVTYTFEMPADKVTVKPTFLWVNPFMDVTENDYFISAVEWMLKHDVTKGTTETTFSPYQNCIRGQIVAFLWRSAGSPAPKSTINPFSDVSEDAYYCNAVLWAVENGFAKGTDDTAFSPDQTVTRGQTVAFLYRMAGSPDAYGNSFSDVEDDAYYGPTVRWAVGLGITQGTGPETFSPNEPCNRAQIGTFLYRQNGGK